jgi:hypothetical protein
MNFGNAGWIRTGDPDGENSYEPPSVSNLETPAFLANAANWSFRSTLAVVGDKFDIHGAISGISSDNWAAGGGSSPAIRLKDILFKESNVSGDSILTEDAGNVVVTMNNNITVTDSVDVRYLVVMHTGDAPDAPADRYTCYTPSLDYTAAPDVVTAVSGQTAVQDPCGNTTTEGNGRVVYIGRDATSFTVTNIPCGSYVYVSVYALKGNGYTANFGTAVTDSILLSNVIGETYYSQGDGKYDDPQIFNTALDGSGTPLGNPISGATVDDFTDCITIEVLSGHTITFPDDLLVGNFKVESGGKAVITASEFTITQSLTAADSLVTDKTTDMVFGGLRIANEIVGTGYIEFANMVIDNRNATVVNQDKVVVKTNVHVREGIKFRNGDLEVTAGDTIVLLSDQANNAAYIGKVPETSSISGTFRFQRYMPTISTSVPSGSGQGVGWRYIGSPVTGATFNDITDDFTTTGFTGSTFPNYTNFDGYYFPNVQKYDESPQGAQSFGFDGDYFTGPTNTATTPPNIRNRRDASESISPGEGVFAYIGPVEATLDFSGTPHVGDLNYNLSLTDNGLPTQDGWNLVANPYACPVFMFNVSVTGSIDNSIYIYNPETGQFVVQNRTSVGTVLAAGQAFWAKATEGASIVFNWEEKDKNETPIATFYKDYTSQYDHGFRLHLEMENELIYEDETFIIFETGATPGFDSEFDGYKFYSLVPGMPGIATTIPDFPADLAVNALPELTDEVTVPIKVNIRLSGIYRLALHTIGDIVPGHCHALYDAELDSSVVLAPGTNYEFFSELRPEDAEPRFFLTLSPAISMVQENASCFNGEDGSATAFSEAEGNFTFRWFDASGEMLLQETEVSESTLPGLAAGFYAVEMEGESLSCGSKRMDFTIDQPEPYVNSVSGVNPDCGIATGYINVFLDERAVWDVSWENLEGPELGAVSGVSEFYAITSLGNGLFKVTTTSACGSQEYEWMLDDGNSVEASFEMSADTVYLSEGGAVTFTNTSLNATQSVWWYGDTQEVPDTALNGSFVYTNAGVYNVTLIAENEEGCFDISENEMVVLNDLGIEEANPAGLVKSYISYAGLTPQLVIEFRDDQIIDIELMSYTGQRMGMLRTTASGETRIDLPVGGLSSGMYLVITTADGTQVDIQKLFVR